VDLFVLVADTNMRSAFEGILAQYQRLGIRPIEREVRSRPGWTDPAVFGRCHDFLRSQQRFASFALVAFDRVGCNRAEPREALEQEVERRLGASGWSNRCAAIVIDPELEAWVWSDSPHVATVLRWGGDRAQLQQWLVQRGHCRQGQQKPDSPKEPVEELLQISRTPRSSSIYRELAARVSFQRCTDPAFLKLRRVLRQWFPVQANGG
jgi:hypothetical protein